MSTPAFLNKKIAVWTTIALTVAYALFVAITTSSDSPSLFAQMLFSEILFTGPIIIGCIMSIASSREKFRITLLYFSIAYFLFSALLLLWTFGFEHDAQYQLAMLLLPLFGFPSVFVVGLAAAVSR
jgi:uncharacterized membrane protein